MKTWQTNLIYLAVRFLLRWLSSNEKNHKEPIYTKAEAEDENRHDHDYINPMADRAKRYDERKDE